MKLNANNLLSSENTMWTIQCLLKGENQILSRNIYSQREYTPNNNIKLLINKITYNKKEKNLKL